MSRPPPEPRFLLVEDDENDVLLFRRALAQCPGAPALDVARDGDDAVTQLEQAISPGSDGSAVPALAILDLKLPRRTGLEVLTWIKAQAALAHLPVTILTSSREASDREQAYAAGANSYLAKPISTAERSRMVGVLVDYWVELNLLPEPRA